MASAALIAMAVLFGLALFSPNYALAFVLIGGAAFALPLFHYVVWGWWLGGMIREDVEEEEERDL